MAEEKQRATYHNGRKGDRGKPIKATHNEHDFEAEHINKAQTSQNKRWLLDYRNAKALKGRHKERVQSMKQFRENTKACPEESIIGIGNMKNQVAPDVLADIYGQYATWHQQEFPNVLFLSSYMHLDEANPHIHERKVWTAYEGDVLIINQEKALEEMGIKRPDPSKPIGRRNNAKMTYTSICRQKLIDIAKEHGLEIEDKPKEASKSGLKLTQYKYEMLKEDYKTLETEIISQREVIHAQSERITELEYALSAVEFDTKETKTVKGLFGKEKEVPKTSEELQHDKAIAGAKLIQQREKEVSKREDECNAREKEMSDQITRVREDERRRALKQQQITIMKIKKEEQEKQEKLQKKVDVLTTDKTKLQAEYDDIKSKYDRLVNPPKSRKELTQDITTYAADISKKKQKSKDFSL